MPPSLTDRQLDLLQRLSELDPPACIFGGFAEEALLSGTVTRPHGDVDWIFLRRDAELRLEQARSLGFTEFETWGEAAPGVPFYLFSQNGDLKVDIGIADELDGRMVVNIHRLSFTVAGRDAPAGYRLRLPDDTFDHPPVGIDGVPIHCASPLALYQIRSGIARQGSFGGLSETQLSAMRRLRERFFADISETDLLPHVEPLTG
jgi:hypothetical protein